MANLFLRVLCTGYVAANLLFEWVGSWVLQTIYKAIAHPFTTVERREDVCCLILRFLTLHGLVTFNVFWHMHVLNPFPQVTNKKVILMLNHLSGVDPMLCLKAMSPRDGTWIAKGDLFSVPFGGWSMRNSGHLPVHFVSKKEGFDTVRGSVGPMMDAARQKLRRGRMVCVFPEGVRSKAPEGPVGEFRLGFFHLALEEGATIVPLAVSGTDRLWPPGKALMDVSDAYFSYGEPIEASRFESAQALAAHTWNVINDLRERHPDRVNGV